MGSETAAEVQLLSFWASPFVMRVKVALAAKGVTYEEVPQELGGGKSALLLQSNPVYGKVPVLLHKGRAVCESIIIAEYIDEAFTSPSVTSAPLLPRDPYERAQARFWADFCEKKVFAAFFKMWKSTQGEEQEASMEEVRAHLTTLEAAYAREPLPFFGAGGAHVGLVDVVLAPLVAWLPLLGDTAGFTLDAQRFPRIHAWAAAFRASPSLAPCIPPAPKLLEFGRSIRSRFVSPPPPPPAPAQ